MIYAEHKIIVSDYKSFTNSLNGIDFFIIELLSQQIFLYKVFILAR